MLNGKIFNITTPADIQAFEETQKVMIETKISAIVDLHNKLMLSSLTSGDNLQQLYHNNSINMKFWGENEQKFDLNEAT